MDMHSGVSLLEVLLALASMAVLIGLLLPAVQEVRSASWRFKCSNERRPCGRVVNQGVEHTPTVRSGRSLLRGDARRTVAEHSCSLSRRRGIDLPIPFSLSRRGGSLLELAYPRMAPTTSKK